MSVVGSAIRSMKNNLKYQEQKEEQTKHQKGRMRWTVELPKAPVKGNGA
jgi:hypothetical protein